MTEKEIVEQALRDPEFQPEWVRAFELKKLERENATLKSRDEVTAYSTRLEPGTWYPTCAARLARQAQFESECG